MRTVFLESVEKETVYLDPQEQHHLTKVLRKVPGYEFVGFDGLGARFRCRLERQGKQWSGVILEKLESKTESCLNIHLAQAMVKKDRFEWVLQKTVELGIGRITPILTWRTEVELNNKRMEKRLTRWQRIVLEAVKQCGRNLVPVVDQPVELGIFLTNVTCGCGISLDENGDTDLKNWLDKNPKPGNISLFIGPEGGWDNRDRELFEQHEIPRICLGERILRTETAAVTAVSILQFLRGDLSDQTS